LSDVLESVRRDIAEPWPPRTLAGSPRGTLGMADAYADGVGAEVARARASCAAFDLSHAAPINVSYHDPEGFLLELSGRSTARGGEIDLVDPTTHTFVDRVLALPRFGTQRTLLGSAMDRAYLHDWLRMRAAPTKKRAK
jgi:hypothetical protein